MGRFFGETCMFATFCFGVMLCLGFSDSSKEDSTLPDRLDARWVDSVRAAGQLEERRHMRFSDSLRLGSPSGQGNFFVLVVRTDERQWTVLEVQMAARKRRGRLFPLLVIRRLVVIRPGGGVALQRSGIELFSGCVLDGDIAQVVPEGAGEDLKLVGTTLEEAELHVVQPAELFLLKKAPAGQLPSLTRPATTQSAAATITGEYDFLADGRERGTLRLEEGPGWTVRGHFISAQTGRSYLVEGKRPGGALELRLQIQLPQSVQLLQGQWWSVAPAVITGTLEAEGHSYGFVAVKRGVAAPVRIMDEKGP
jgi:hypothetical protein